MPLLIVQQGHCYRTAGATGTAGEQSYATAVAKACVTHLNGRASWTVRTTLADVNDYRADAFFSVHCDGANSSSARGASAGYQNAEGQQLAQAWKRAYAARGWPIFRPDNYTAALANYYGVAKAVAAGTRRAMIAECGFLTSPEDRALLLAPEGPARVALALGDALGITTPPAPPTTLTTEDDIMYLRNIGPDGKERWAIGSGKWFIGLAPGEETDSAIEQAEAGRAAAQWVTTATWDAWVQYRNVEMDNRELLKMLVTGTTNLLAVQQETNTLLSELLGMIDGASEAFAAASAVGMSEQQAQDTSPEDGR